MGLLHRVVKGELAIDLPGWPTIVIGAAESVLRKHGYTESAWDWGKPLNK